MHAAALAVPTAYSSGLPLMIGVPSAIMAALGEITAALAVFAVHTRRASLPPSIQIVTSALDVVNASTLPYEFMNRGVSTFVRCKSFTRIVRIALPSCASFSVRDFLRWPRRPRLIGFCRDFVNARDRICRLPKHFGRASKTSEYSFQAEEYSYLGP
jgi:hypothetical protein